MKTIINDLMQQLTTTAGINKLLMTITVITGTATTMDTIEQIGRIILLVLAIVSTTMICFINFDQAKKVFNIKKDKIIKYIKDKCKLK